MFAAIRAQASQEWKNWPKVKSDSQGRLFQENFEYRERYCKSNGRVHQEQEEVPIWIFQKVLFKTSPKSQNWGPSPDIRRWSRSEQGISVICYRRICWKVPDWPRTIDDHQPVPPTPWVHALQSVNKWKEIRDVNWA